MYLNKKKKKSQFSENESSLSISSLYFSCLTKDSIKQFPQMSTYSWFDLKISSGNHLSVKCVTEGKILGSAWFEMFQMKILYLYVLNYSSQFTPALIFKRFWD